MRKRSKGSCNRTIDQSYEAAARAALERLLRFYDEGHVNRLVVTIIESANNENALVAPVIEAVHDVMRRRRNWTPQLDGEGFCVARGLRSPSAADEHFGDYARTRSLP